MFSFRTEFTAVLLLFLTRSLVRASFKDEKIQTEALTRAIINSMQVPWVDGIDSMMRSTETSCAEEIAAMSQAIVAQETWAMQMVDASSKLQSGILKGNTRDLGMYDECVESKGQYNGTNVQGQYCTVSFSSISSAICVPSSCNETDVVEIVNAVLQNVTGIAGLDLGISEVSCVPVGSEDFTAAEILTILFFSAVGAFIIFCTVCEFLKKWKPTSVSPVINELAKFSLYTNATALLSTKISPQMMPAIQGIRFLSMCWVVLGHRFVNVLYGPMMNLLDFFEWFSSWSALYILIAPFAVDTFFVISGFLMTYLFLKSKQSGRRSNFPMMYLHRYLRLTPSFAALMLFVIFLLHRIGHGPVWNEIISTTSGNCRKNWWVNLLYVQNFVDVENMCLGYSWYLAVDMQLFWISPFILYPLHRWPKWGLGILGLFLSASVVVPTVILVINEYSNAVIRFTDPTDKLMISFYKFYIPTYTRACAYFVGMFLGYDVANKKRHFTKVNVAINWFVACAFMLACGWATKQIYDLSLDYNLAMEIAFAILLRPLWSIGIAWIMYACCFGYGGAITKFLSLPIFLPLSRLSYCIYLVHMTLQLVKTASVQTPGRFTDFLIMNQFWSDIVLSIVLAFILSLFFESPVVILEKMLTNRGRAHSPVRETKKDLERGVDNKGMTE